MSFYGRLTSGLVALALTGMSAAYVASAAGSVAQAAEQLSCYVIREYGEGAALFKEGEDEPLAVYSLPADGLTAADTALLKEGIRLRRLSEVSCLLEGLELIKR